MRSLRSISFGQWLGAALAGLAACAALFAIEVSGPFGFAIGMIALAVTGLAVIASITAVEARERRAASSDALRRSALRILELVARGEYTDSVLEALVELVERDQPGVRGSILLVRGGTLTPGAGRRMPTSYWEKVDGLTLDPDTGTCGAAIARRRAVVTRDILVDPLWASYRAAVEDWGVRACWSQPILDRRGEVVGTFALYFDEPLSEEPSDDGTLSLAAHLAGIALDRQRLDERLRDSIAELEQARVESDRLRADAETASAAKSDFIARISHEIRTPMTAILGYAELLGETARDDAERERTVALLRRNGEHLLALIDDMLDMARIESSGLEVEIAPADPASLIEGVVASFRREAESKGIDLSLGSCDALPARIATDPARLRQILSNLVGNAVKFTVRGSVRIEASLVAGNPAILRVEVSDTGIGIAPDHGERLFEPFMQVDAGMSRRFGGTGLGLPISRHLARLLGGDIVYRSEPGAGSVFTLTVGCGAASAPPAQDRAQAELRGRVLLAEDGIDNQRIISFHLRRAGATVEIVANGREALEQALAADPPFDLIVMDMQMPELDGYAATARLRAAGYRGAVVALTAHAAAGDRERCLAAGCDDFATKPIDRERLLETCRRWCGARSSSRLAA